jgi:hypothetical protein
MARPEITGRAPAGVAKSRKRMPRNRGPPSLAFTIAEFCDSHRFSRSHYYNLKRLGLGPDESDVGGVIIITVESAARWRRQQEGRAALSRKEQPTTPSSSPARPRRSQCPQ